MQETGSSSSPQSIIAASTASEEAMSPYHQVSIKYESSPLSSRTPSPNLTSCGINEPIEMTMTTLRANAHTSQPTSEDDQDHEHDQDTRYKDISDDEISVGCPSPLPTTPKSHSANPRRRTSTSCNDSDNEDYFKPLKRLKMLDIEREREQEREREREQERTRRISPTVDDEQQQQQQRQSDNAAAAAAAVGVKSFSIMDILNHRPALSKGQPTRIVRPWDLDPDVEAQQNLERFHRHLKVQQLALLRPEFAAFNASYASETGSDRSSSVASDCCSPDIVPAHHHLHNHQLQQQRQQQQGRSGAKTTPSGTPLDALFQMTSKTFDSNTGESSTDGQSHLNLFNNRQQPKKKRKSRTAFTNHQIFELEKRFLYQKYLSPADRDEIASSLGLTNAQVITWFQNRRAKLKRDMEELKKDVENSKVINAHKSFLENVQDLGILKKKAIMSDDDCAKNLVISHEK